MLGIRGTRKKNVTSAASMTTKVTGLITVTNGSALRTVTVARSDFKTQQPMIGWYVNYSTFAQHARITGVTVSGANYVLSYSGGTAFIGGVGGSYNVTNK